MDLLDFGTIRVLAGLAAMVQLGLLVLLFVVAIEMIRFLRAANRLLPRLHRWLDRAEGSP